MSTYESSITNPKKQLEFYEDLSKQLEKEAEELKKQLEKLDKKLFLTKHELDMREKTIDNKLNQQKEFIKYLEDEIKLKSLNATCMFEYNDTVLPLKSVLQKYKKIIGVSDENN